MKFDCGMSDAEHCEWELRLIAYEYIFALYASVGDVFSFFDEKVAAEKDGWRPGFEMAEICDDINALFDPVLQSLQNANKQLRSKYGLTEQNQSSPNNRRGFSK